MTPDQELSPHTVDARIALSLTPGWGPPNGQSLRSKNQLNARSSSAGKYLALLMPALTISAARLFNEQVLEVTHQTTSAAARKSLRRWSGWLVQRRAVAYEHTNPAVAGQGPGRAGAESISVVPFFPFPGIGWRCARDGGGLQLPRRPTSMA